MVVMSPVHQEHGKGIAITSHVLGVADRLVGFAIYV